MDKLTLDFENNTITIETEHQQGTEYYDNLIEKKGEIHKLLGFETVNISPVVKALEDLFNGNITEEEFNEFAEEFIKEE